MKHNVRLATREDADAIFSVARKFYTQTHGIRPIPANMLAVIKETITKGTVAVSEQDGEVLGLLIVDVFYDYLAGRWDAREVMWFSTNGTGGALVDFMEERCKQIGCTGLFMTVIEDAPEVAHKLIKRKGYEQVERTYRKVL